VILNGPGQFSGRTSTPSNTLTPLSLPMYEGLRDHNTVFSGMLGHWLTPVHFADGARTENADADLVTGTYFNVLGLTPAVGRLLGPRTTGSPAGTRSWSWATSSGRAASAAIPAWSAAASASMAIR
jgi:hypothetical protein